MRTIYDKKKEKEEAKASSFSYSPSKDDLSVRTSGEIALSDYDKSHLEQLNQYDVNTELGILQDRANAAMDLVDNIVLKNYLTKLSGMEVVESQNLTTDDIILFKINKMVYEKDEYATDKFISVVSAMTYTDSSIFLIVDGHQTHTDFYMGIKSDDPNRGKSSVAETLKNSLLGQFPGAIIEDYSKIEAGKEKAKQDKLLYEFTQASNISSCVGMPSYKNSKGEYTNANFIQGIEKFASAMHGKRYTAIVLATNVSKSELSNIREGYERIYAELSGVATRQLAYSTTESLANALSRTKGYTETESFSRTKGTSETEGTSKTKTKGTSTTTTTTHGTTKDNAWGMAGKLADPLMEAGAILTATGVGAPIGAIMMGVGAIAGIGSTVGAKQVSDSEAKSESTNESTSDTVNQSRTTNKSTTKSDSHAESFSETDGTTSTVGSTKNFTVTVQNKRVQDILKRIDKQLDRVDIGESTGLWSTGAYFLSYGSDRASAEIGATIFRSIMQGEQSGVECSAINTWNPEDRKKYIPLINSLRTLSHPMFKYEDTYLGSQMELLSTSLLSSKELAILMGLPRKSVPGLPVIEHISLGKEVVRINKEANCDRFNLGCIFDQGVERKENKVWLDTKSLTQHTFVTGSTGCGKSNTIYYLIQQIRNNPLAPKVLVIEPAKGEYKDVFGNEHIYGTNPLKTPLLKINPFRFPEGVHVLEHVDRLIEIFNVCWPMYAAMPAVLKEAVLNAYEDCGWDLIKSTNKYSNQIFPTFSDLIWELETVIEMSKYSEEVKSNYKGSLVTRIKSLANGINGEIFCGEEIGDERLFDENVIVDISRIGSQETKALIMGVLIMRLNEYRANSGIKANSSLRHVTILEEAHNLLKRCSQEQSMEGSNLAGKSVEMISNAIAEMRTYGEGFIIVDQSPGAVDVSAIRNTNTKIIMRLPEESDRKIAGKSAAMKDYQIDEIAKLPTGVAVVYQNDWEEPVLCQIEKFNGDKFKYEFKEDIDEIIDIDVLKVEILKFMLQKHLSQPLAYDIDLIKTHISSSSLPTSVKINILETIQEFDESGKASIWEQSEFVKLSWIVSSLLGIKHGVYKLAKSSKNYDDLTYRLKILIHDKVKGLPLELDMAILQSLLRDYSTGGEKCLQLYSDWLRIARQQMK